MDLRRRTNWVIFILGFIYLLQSCAARDLRRAPILPGRPPQLEKFFVELDAAVAAFGVQNAAFFRVSGFPYLRTNRFIEAMGPKLAGDDQLRLWAQWMRRLDAEAREKEIQNLPDKALAELEGRIGKIGDRRALARQSADAAAQMFASDLKQPGFWTKLKSAVRVPGEYSTPMRIFGLYPLAAVPVAIATLKVYEDFKKWHRSSPESLTVDGRLTVFVPETGDRSAADEPAATIGRSPQNALGLPDLNHSEILKLVRTYAPVVVQDVAADYDRFGEVVWREGRVAVDPSRPTVYYYLTHSFIDSRPLLQINYAFWYSERSGRRAPAYEKGPLDGITVRISVDQDGLPVMVDIMNNCGCYHFYVPRRERVEKVMPGPLGLYPFIPTWMPEAFPDRPLAVRVNSGWHQIENIGTPDRSPDAQSYRLLAYDVLESLPNAGKQESVFDADGIMKDSKRIEPYIFFSMGIPKVGYMRQRGHHAVKLVGRAHFTDPDIYDRYFVFK